MTKTTKPTAVFMMGGPGSGKSYIRIRDFGSLPVLDSDSIKAEHPDYDPKAPELLHAWSAAELVKKFYRTVSAGEDFTYDGTGSAAERYVKYIRHARELGYHVTLVYVRCTLATALARNANRTRVVPENIVTDKHSLIATSFDIVSPEATEVHVINNN